MENKKGSMVRKKRRMYIFKADNKPKRQYINYDGESLISEDQSANSSAVFVVQRQDNLSEENECMHRKKPVSEVDDSEDVENYFFNLL